MRASGASGLTGDGLGGLPNASGGGGCTEECVLPLVSYGFRLQEDADVEALCHYPECLLVLRDADRIQRWHRRRLLALWWHRISQPHGPKGGS